MTRRPTHALAAMYAVAALFLIRCATVSWQHGSWPYACLFTGASVLLVTAIVHESLQRDELRAALARLERATRPAHPGPAIEDAVAIELGAACCEMWWTSAGAEHDAPCTSRWATSVACCPECAVEPGTTCHDDGRPRAEAHPSRVREAKRSRA